MMPFENLVRVLQFSTSSLAVNETFDLDRLKQTPSLLFLSDEAGLQRPQEAVEKIESNEVRSVVLVWSLARNPNRLDSPFGSPSCGFLGRWSSFILFERFFMDTYGFCAASCMNRRCVISKTCIFRTD